VLIGIKENNSKNKIIKDKKMFKGLRTVVYFSDNIDKARKWYSDILGFAPYFDTPYYVGFNVGGYELGLHPYTTGVSFGDNAVAYWGVDNIEKSLEHLLKNGAVKESDIQDVGEGIKLATVKDPFGNISGIIENPHFKTE